jgi:enoyl-CoA hydratase/carnithine racemase
MGDEAFRYCRLDRNGQVLTITIDRPEVLNALHPEAHVELQRAFDLYAEDDHLHVAIITGMGERAFCVGTDLKALARTGDHRKPSGGFGGLTTRHNLYKPVIAAVNGLCLGGGTEIVAACDLAIASESATFGLVEPRVGLAATGGGALQRLARHLPMKDAMMLALTGQQFDAREALRISLVNQVVAQQDLMEACFALASKILACAPLAIQASKQVMLQSLAIPDLEAAMNARYEAVDRMMNSQDAIEGPLAFAQKRRPHWLAR